MTVPLAVALLALLVALFALVALVAVYARVRGLEAGVAAGPSGYPTLVGRPAPPAVRPGPQERCALVAVVDGDCALCRTLLSALAELSASPEGSGVRIVGLTDRVHDHPPQSPGSPAPRAFGGLVEGSHLATALPAGALRVDAAARADLFEGYAPTVLAVDSAGTVVGRQFVYPDTDVPAVLRELTRQASRTAITEMDRA